MDFVQARYNMVNQQVRTWDVLDQRVLGVLSQIPRDAFVPERYQQLAYADTDIPLADGELMLKPVVEGRLLQALDIQVDDTVLEIGTGSGYLTACLASLSAYVHSVDINPDMVNQAQKNLDAQAITNVSVVVGDAAEGWDQEAPYDVIVIGGAYPEYPEHWQHHLKVGGRLFVMVGHAPVMDAILVTRTADNEWQRQTVFEALIPELQNVSKIPEFVL